MLILSYNILEGGLGRIDPLAEVIRQSNADVVACPEATDPEEFAKLAARLGMDFFIGGNPRNAEGAVGLLVRPPYELVEAVNYAPLDPRLTRSALHAIVRLPTGGTLALIAVHLHARETLSDEAQRLAELPAVLDLAARFGKAPHVLMGDFNAHHPEQIIDLTKIRDKTRERIAPQGNVIPREVVRKILDAGYVDAHAHLRRPADFGVTLTTSQPALRTDYVFLPPALVPAVQRCDVLASSTGLLRYASDHFPVLAELAL